MKTRAITTALAIILSAGSISAAPRRTLTRQAHAHSRPNRYSATPLSQRSTRASSPSKPMDALDDAALPCSDLSVLLAQALEGGDEA